MVASAVGNHVQPRTGRGSEGHNVMRLIDFFDKGVELDPQRAFLIDEHGRRTYRQVQALSHRMANAFRRDALAPGTKIAVYGPNMCCAFECVIGILRAGCIWVPVSIRNTVDDSAYVLNHTDTEVLFYTAGFHDNVMQIVGKCPGLKHVVCIDAQLGGHRSLAEWIDGLADRSEEVAATPDDVATLFSSGGTTGNPKGVMMTNQAWETMIAGAQRLTWLEGAVHLVAAPMTHAAGGSALMMAPMGATNVMLPGFDPVRVMTAIQEHRVTHLFLPPTAVYRVLAHPDVRKYDYSSLRFFNYASAPMAPEKIKEAMQIFGPVMMTGLGQTELGVNVTFFSPEDHARALAAGKEERFLSCGKPTLFARVEIMADDGTLLGVRTPGEIVVRGNQRMKGYYKNPEETARAAAFGWHHTGDVGFKDEDGYVYLVDRKRDMVISGGFNIFPAEIEKVIVAHPAVQECAVVGVPDADWGEAVKAVVELKPGCAVEIAEIVAFCRQRLSSFKVPKSVEIWPELPRSPVGKVLRRKVRERYWAGRTRTI
jgi:acyl-CoA synthetase (AMP-forming)/AMP-acid ligase II